MEINKVLPILLWLVSNSVSQRQGERCVDNTNSQGVCERAHLCPRVLEVFNFNKTIPKVCSYTEEGALVCCRDGSRPKKPTVESSQAWNDTERPVNIRRVSERKCDEYKRGVIEKVEINPLLLPVSEIMEESSCNYNGVGISLSGARATPGEFPHMAAIGWPNFDTGGYQFKCGGSLISPRFVLTAAHCYRSIFDVVENPAVVVLGEKNINASIQYNATPVTVSIKAIHKYPDYKESQKYYDLALIELTDDVVFEPHIRPACLWTKDDFGGYSEAVVSGWQIIDGVSDKSSTNLKKAALTLIENERCNRMLASHHNRKWQGMIESQMCAGDLVGGKDTCQGDSGTPLQVTADENHCVFYVIGVTSFGIGRCGGSYPTIFSRVSSYLDWIESIVWPGN